MLEYLERETGKSGITRVKIYSAVTPRYGDSAIR